VVSEGLVDLSCCGNPIKRNSVLDGLRLRKLEIIQNEIEAIFLCIQDSHWRSSQDEKKYKAECHLHTSDVRAKSCGCR